MSAAFGALGLGVVALASLAFIALVAGALVYVVVVGDPEAKHWRAWATAHGWECDGPWRVAGGPPEARWSLDAAYDDDRGTGTISWTMTGLPASASRVLVLRRVDYERDPGRVERATEGLRDFGVGGPHFAPQWVVLAADEPSAHAFLTAETEAAWVSALAETPRLHADDDVMFEVRPPLARLRAEGATRRPPLDEVATFVGFGLTLAARADRT